MKLPAALTPWSKHLQIFPEEISLILGGYVQRISPFIAPINSAFADETGEPNGYDGVARSGIYERLLLSELALADDFSEEFIRRAVMGEHLFLNLAKISPNAKRVSIALFDAGAMQIGAPRIAHLAAFIVLARRAEAANSMFLWGVLQDAKQLVISDDTESSIKILLESRTANDVSSEDISGWREKLSDIEKTADVWLVGSENLAKFEDAKEFSHLYVGESLELEKRELLLKLKSGSGAERQTVLELPPPNICTRLLRNPFETPKTIEFNSAKLSGNVTNFFFDNTGSKLFARLDSFEVLCFPVQNVQSTAKIHPAAYQFDSSINYLAAGRLRKAIAFVFKTPDGMITLQYRKSGFNLPAGLYRVQDAEISFPENENGLLQIYNVRPRKFHYEEAAILDANCRLFLLNRTAENDAENIVGTVRPLAENVLAVAQTDDKFIYIGCEDGNDYHLIVSISDKIERHSLAGKRLKRAFFGRGEMGKKVIGYETESENWMILDDELDERIMPRPKGEVVGVFQDSRLAPKSGFFELMEDRRTLEFSWQYGRRKTILTAEEEIVKVEFSPRSPILAYQTKSGELVIYSLTHRAPIGRYSK